MTEKISKPKVITVSRYTVEFLRLKYPIVSLNSTYEDQNIYDYESSIYYAWNNFVIRAKNRGISCSLVEENNNPLYYRLSQDNIIPSSEYLSRFYDRNYTLYLVLISDRELKRIDELSYEFVSKYFLDFNKLPGVKEFLQYLSSLGIK